MRRSLAMLVAVFAAVLLCNATAHAACMVNYYGVLLADSDCDGVLDADATGEIIDNCPLNPNGDCAQDPLNCDVNQDGRVTPQEIAAGYQADWNHDGIGDACEDTDKDGVPDYLDNCRSTPNPDQNPAACTDTDHDGVEDPVDNCPLIYNPDQTDTDSDGVGDACDNCPYVANPTQDPAACATGGQGQTFNIAQPGGNSRGIAGGAGLELGPDRMQGNGLGNKGGCTLCAEAPASAAPALLFLIAAVLLVFRARRRDV